MDLKSVIFYFFWIPVGVYTVRRYGAGMTEGQSEHINAPQGVRLFGLRQVNLRRFNEVLLFRPRHRFFRRAESTAVPRLNFGEYQTILITSDNIDLAPAGAEIPRQNFIPEIL